jgi:regulator of sigma E protease
MNSVLGFLAMLGPLVVVHEFGHYLFAKLFGVKAETFSVGFGPKIWGKQVGETDWRFSLIPLGGYVKLLGEEPGVELTPELKPRSLGAKPRWQRLLIFFGGPLFNFLFAILVYMVILVLGEPLVASRIARVTPGSAAERAGFRNGDLILETNGIATPLIDQVDDEVEKSAGRPVRFKVERDGAQIELTGTPTAKSGFGPYGEVTQLGVIDGLFTSPRSLHVGVSNSESLVGKQGLRTSDELVSLNGMALKSWEDMEKKVGSLENGTSVRFEYRPSGSKELKTIELTLPAEGQPDLGRDWGLYSSELFVEKAVESSPALSGGLQKGDRIIRIGSRDLKSFFQLRDAVQESGEKTNRVAITWEREGKTQTVEVEPTSTVVETPTHEKITQYTVGLVPMLTWLEPAVSTTPIYNPFLLVGKSVERVAIVSWRNVVSLAKMFTGEVSIKNLGGPLLIGKLAGESLGRGLISFLMMMAVLSIGLGVLNLFPIPVLDGGQIFLLGLESVRGKPLSLHQMERIQMVSLGLILLLMAVVIRNDIARIVN